jgi:hypothetical protein
MGSSHMPKESMRLKETAEKNIPWKKWGPYLSDRQWGTVREDYSPTGTPWEYFPHDHARSRAYRWGEDGIGGICDDKQILCFALALWNGRDPILKERYFGLTGKEGNHGEDVKEYYYYLDNTPTHSYMKMLYKYPQEAFPYDQLVDENQSRGKNDTEFELIDTGIFDENKYFDVFIEYAKAAPEELLIKITAHNRGAAEATLHLIPQIWFRNTWSWNPDKKKPRLSQSKKGIITATDNELGQYYLNYEEPGELLFCENETNVARLFNQPGSGSCKDGINDHIVIGKKNVLNQKKSGTKLGIHYKLIIPTKSSQTIRLKIGPSGKSDAFHTFEKMFADRLKEADEFYRELQKGIKSEDEKNIQRQAFAGMLWSKQFYYFDVCEWLNGDPGQPKPPAQRKTGRDHQWIHLNNADIISMPDKWEYPWYAAWDLAFHCIPFAMIDAAFAKHQLVLLTKEWYMHPNGQLPAYEWSFSDVNPPVHAWAAWRLYKIDRKNQGGKGDIDFLERVYHKLLINFTWWVNRKDKDDRNIFQGGFLGLDNIGVFDRSKALPTGGYLEQSDGTSWMAMYCLNMMQISLELAIHKSIYQDMATKFLEHFLYIAGAMTNAGGHGINLWDEEDSFYYDVLHAPDNEVIPLKVRSMVGLIPLFAVETLEPEFLDKVPDFKARLEWFLNYRKDLSGLVSRWYEPGLGERRLLSLLRGHRMKMLLKRMLDETEFLSDYGVRALSKYHEKNPYVFHSHGQSFSVNYTPGESDSGLFGGNSNWRGPIWFPLNYLIIESLQKFHHYYGDDFKIEYPTGSGKMLTINEVANKLAQRLIRIFRKDKNGRRVVFGENEKFQTDPHFRDYIPFYEYFHGDNGRGVGASHQTGWTGLVAKLIHPRRK